MKRIISFLLALILLLLLVSCGNNADSHMVESSSVQTGTSDSPTNNVGDDKDNQPEPEETENVELKHDSFWIERFMSYEIGSTGEFWVQAINEGQGQDNGNSVFVAMDAEKNPLYTLSTDDYSICSGIYDKISVVKDEKQYKKVILDGNGLDITTKYADVDNGEEVITISEDVTGITIWTIQDIDTYDKHITTLYAKSLQGEIKQSWDSEKFRVDSARDGIYYVANGIYRFDRIVINLINGNGFSLPRSGNGSAVHGVDENGFVYVGTNDGVGEELFKFTDSGETVWKLYFRNGRNQPAKIGKYAEGFIYASGEDFNGFIDANGNYAIDISLYASNYPIFVGKYALVELRNEAGVKFVSLFDKQGNMLFEPVKGSEIFSYGNTAIIDENVVIFDSTGNRINAPWLVSDDGFMCKYSNGKYFVIENGQIIDYVLP